MPGAANWKTIYRQEYQQLYEEGYPVGDSPKPDEDFSEAGWEKAYWTLWQTRTNGLRTDFPFVEPNDYAEIILDAVEVPFLQTLEEDEYIERVKGAWYGRCAGVVLGKPFEMGMTRQDIQDYLESVNAYPLRDWAPIRSEKLNKTLRMNCLPSSRGFVEYVQPDDDIHYTILALLLTEKKGLDFNKFDVGMNLLDNIPYNWLWSCTKQSYYHLVNLTEGRSIEEQIAEIPTRLNPWREGINGAIRADFWGYMAPGNPRRAARIAHQEAAFNTVKNGTYGSMFVAGCISAALSKNPTIENIIQGGLSVIPKKSRLAKVVEEVTGWYAREGDWILVCDKIYEKYGHLWFASCLNNMAIVVLALIHGQLDYTKAITTAVMCGIDTDCNGGTVGSIVGAAVGYAGLDQRWISPLNDRVKTVVANFGEGSISDLVRRTIQVWRKTDDGGMKT